MRIDLPSGSNTVDMVLMLSQQFPRQSAELMELCNASKEGVTVELMPTKAWHSRPQENYYRNWCRQFATWCGMTPDELHDELLCKCYGSEEVETKMGVRRRPLKRSSGASKKEFSELIDTLIQTAAEFDFVIPPANEVPSDD